MDSCHLFNFLFGTRKATTQLSECFSPNGSKRQRRATDRTAAGKPPVSPLKQIHSKIVSFANAAATTTTTKLAPDGPRPECQPTMDHLELQQQQQQHSITTVSSRPIESGTYKATLIELPTHDDADQVDENNNAETPASNQTSQQAGGAEVILYGNPVATSDNEPAERHQDRRAHWRRASGSQPTDKSQTSSSERVRHLVQSFESFDGAHEQPAAGAPPRSPGGRNLRLKWPPQPPPPSSSDEAPSAATGAAKPTTIVKPLPPKTPPKSNRAKCLNHQLSLNKASCIEQLFQDDHFLARHFFVQLRPLDRCTAAQVCRRWRKILYANSAYWSELVGVIDCMHLRREHLIECIASTLQSAKLKQLAGSNPQQQQQQQQQQLHGQRKSDSSGELEPMEWLDQAEIWRIQDLCNRYARGSHAGQHLSSRPPISSSQQQQHSTSCDPQQQPNCLANSRSQSSIRSQMSSTLSSVSISSLLSPLSESSRAESMRERLYTTLDERGFDALCLFGANDDDIDELATKTRPQGAHLRVRYARLTNCPLSDRALHLFVATFSGLEELELTGCNEITNALELKPLRQLKRLTITDCINIADGLAQRLVAVFHQLEELVLQAYHLTDAFLEFLSLNNDTSRLTRLELPNCKEITNSTMLTIAKHFGNVRVLSISGSSKISDDGVELLTEHAKQLRRLDLGWCARISDVSLECIACDLGATLTELVLDRNLHITDAGLGYLATMGQLRLLHIRWCPRITDLGLESVLGLRSLRRRSLAGLHQVTARSLLALAELAGQLEELELTNCAAVNWELAQFLRSKMPGCNVIF